MPPKAKFSREEIVQAALTIVREEGFDALTARALGAGLSSSPRPIFTVFQSMNEVQAEVVQAAKAVYNAYIEKALSPENKHPFKSVGEQYILFAMREPKLFQLLFMQEQESVPGITGVLALIDSNYEAILSSIQKEYGLERACSHNLYQHLWVYSHGIASLCATRMCRFTGKEIESMISEVFLSLLRQMKGGGKDD